MVDTTRQKPTSQSVPNLGAMGTYAVIPENSVPSNGKNCINILIWIVYVKILCHTEKMLY